MQLGKVGKIVAAGTLAALMAGSSVAFAQLNNLPAPFVTAAGPQSLVIVGAAADPSDIVGAIDIAARLGGEVTTDVAIPGAGATASVSGEGREIGTRTQQIFLNTNLKTNGLRTALSSSDMPTLLKSGTIDTTASDFDYDLFIDFDDFVSLNFGRPDSNLDPQYFFGEFGTSATTGSFLYRTRIVFTDEVNLTQVANEDMEVFGGSYTWGSTSDLTTTKIVLFGSPDTRTMSEGEEIVTTVGGTTATVRLDGVSDADTVVVTVNGNTETIDKGQTKSIGGVEIFLDDVFFFSKEGQVSSAKLGIGATKLTLTDGSPIKATVAGQEKTVDGTLVDILSSAGKITGIDIYVVGQDSRTDFLAEGGAFMDPIWKSFGFSFPTLSDPIMSSARDKIEIHPSGTKDTILRFWNDRGDFGSIEFAHIDSVGTLGFGDDNADPIILTEGEAIDRDDFFAVDAGDFSRLFELTSAVSLGTADSELTIRDVFSGDSLEVKLGSSNAADKVIDGQTYHFNASAAVDGTDVNLKVTWGDASALLAVNRGTFVTMFPLLETRNSGKIAVMNPEGVELAASAVQNVSLPTGVIQVAVTSDASAVNITFPASTEKGGASASATASPVEVAATTKSFQLGRTSTGGARYNVTWADGGTAGNLTIRLAHPTSGVAVTTPAVLLVEEEDDDSNVFTVHSAVTDTSDDETTVGAPVHSYTSSKSGTRPGNTDITRSVDLWGTFGEHDTSGDQDRLTLYYPDEQVFGTLFLLGEGSTVVTGNGSAGGTVKAAVPIKTPLGKLDTEVTDADKNTKHLVLVGGPVVNDLVADLAAAGKTRDTQWYRDQGAGTALIDYVADAFVSGRAALVVAGHSAPDTRVAASKIQTFDTSGLTGSRVVLKNGVISTTTA